MKLIYGNFPPSPNRHKVVQIYSPPISPGDCLFLTMFWYPVINNYRTIVATSDSRNENGEEEA